MWVVRDHMTEITPSRWVGPNWVIATSQCYKLFDRATVADWPLRYILQNFTGFPPPKKKTPLLNAE